MQGILLFLFALIAVICAQQPDSGAGCCFFRKSGFQDEIRCSSESFTIADVNSNRKGKETEKKDGIGSFFCTERFSAAIQNAGVLEELIDCGDVVNETTSPIPTDSITIGECLQRRCCWYTTREKGGNEFCVNTDETPADELPRVQVNESFAVGECLEDWKAVGHAKDGTIVNFGCGETVDLPANINFVRILTSPCARPRAEMEAVEDDLAFDNFAADQQVDQAVSGDFVDEELVDQAVYEYSEDFTAADQQVDQAVFDEAVAADYVEEEQVDQFAADQQVDQAVLDFDDTADQFAVDEFAADQQVDQAVSGDFVDEELVDQALVDAAFADEAVADEQLVDDAFVDQAVADFADEELAADNFDDQPADQAVMDMEGDAFVDPAFVEEGYDQAFMDESFSDYELEESNFDQNY